jgi:hypothetical protein
MNRKITLLVPEAPAPETVTLVGQRRVEKARLRLGILDNSKGNADHLLKFLVDGVRAALSIASVVALRKSSPTLPAPAAMLDQLAAEADFVVSAMGD